ncbi:MAG: peptidoglycan editing factor PgeF [Calditrichaeota bacterium]|nr:peptidoglycan editing factor PgeF [Calditrichota bacterium]
MPIPVKTFALFKNYPVIHGFSTRQGGVSKGYFASLNLGLNTLDKDYAVKENRNIFLKQLGLEHGNLVFPQQIHSANIAIVNEPGIIPECDALVTNIKNLVLTIQTADCFPVFIFDPVKNVCAIIHSGWRGTAAAIVPKTIQKMVTEFACAASDLLAAIGPGIQQRNYQVDRMTANNFAKEFILIDGPDHFRLDIQGAIKKQLTDNGVLPKHIETDETCTLEAAEFYYSYRRDGNKSGRMMGIIALK